MNIVQNAKVTKRLHIPANVSDYCGFTSYIVGLAPSLFPSR